MILNKTLQSEGLSWLGLSPLTFHPESLFKQTNKLHLPFHLEEIICNYTLLNTASMSLIKILHSRSPVVHFKAKAELLGV